MHMYPFRLIKCNSFVIWSISISKTNGENPNMGENKEDPIQVVKSVSLNIRQRDFKNLFNKLE